MTQSNLDLARECGASSYSRPRPDKKMPEPEAWRIRYRSGPGMLGHYPWTYTDRKPRRQNDTAHEVEPVFTAAQVQAMLAQALATPPYDQAALSQPAAPAPTVPDNMQDWAGIMTQSNLDLARECGAVYDSQWEDEYIVAGLRFTPKQLDAFAERIRADAMAEYAVMTAKGAKAWADVPDATEWVDELRGSATGDSLAPVQFSPVFEAWAKSLDMDLSRTPEFYGDCNTDYAWLAWQAATANERERCAALADNKDAG